MSALSISLRSWWAVPVVAALALSGTVMRNDARGESPRCPGFEADSRPQIVGTDGPDMLHVPEGAIGCGLGGNDKLRADSHGGTVLSGGDGNDVFCARNVDHDKIFGDEGEDKANADDTDTLNSVEREVVVIACRAGRGVRAQPDLE